MAGIPRLGRGNRHERAAFMLYGAAVTAAREPFLYQELAVPDTLDGRFDLVGAYAFLLIHRLTAAPEPGPALAQAVFDAMFSDMDVNLREMGVGDLSVGRRVRAMWEAFHGRANAYTAALNDSDPAVLESALARNVWRGAAAGTGPARLARLMRAQAAHLAGQSLDALKRGAADFLPAAVAAQ